MSDNDQLKKEIEGYSKDTMAKVSDDEKAVRDAEKKKRAEELEVLKAKLKAKGEWEE